MLGELSLCQVRGYKQEHEGEERGQAPPETSRGCPPCWGASRRGSQPVLGEGAVQASVLEEMPSKGSWGSVHWLEVEGWERPGGRLARAEPEPAGRRGPRVPGEAS